MLWMLLVLFLMCPFVELVVIIVLAVKNHEYKKMNEVLKQQLCAQGIKGMPDASRSADKTVAGSVRDSGGMAAPGRTSAADVDKAARPEADVFWKQGTPALVIGVIFVLLAGLIFATTTWNRLADFGKVVLIFAGSLTFFTASLIAVRKLKIEKTGKAFYILGSMFLFVAVLAVGYFGILGAEFSLTGRYRLFLLALGILLTDGALFAGLKHFGEKAYAYICLFGVTLAAACTLGGFQPSSHVFTIGMTVYGICFLFLTKKKVAVRSRFCPELIKKILPSFAVINLWVISVCLFLAACFRSLAVMEIDLSGVVCMGALTLDVTVLALEKKHGAVNAAWACMVMVFVHYLLFYLPLETEYQILAVAAVSFVLFLIGRRRSFPLAGMAGDVINTTVIAVDMLVLISLLGFAYGRSPVSDVTLRMAASAAVVILICTYVAGDWTRRYPVFRGGMPLVSWFLTLPFGILLEDVSGITVSYKSIVLGYLILVVLWDVLKKDDFLPGILLIGTAAAWAGSWWKDGNLPYCLILAVYLMCKAGKKKGEERTFYDYGICCYILAGTYLAVYDITRIYGYRMLITAGIYLVLWLVYQKEVQRMGRFFEILGSLLYIGVITAYYHDPSLGLWFLVPVLGCFAGIYLLCYHGRCSWLNVVTTLFTLGIPALLAGRYGFSTNQLYGGVMAAVLVSGLLFRHYQPIAVKAPGHGWRIDWYHVLVVLVLAPMQIVADRQWGFFYLLLLAVYALQFTAVPSLRNPAYTMAGVLGCLAFWNQPFFIWPEIVSQEIKLIPAACFVYSLTYIWGRKKVTGDVQTILYLFCLLSLVLDGFWTQKVADALMIEGICLVIFLAAFLRGCRRWVYLSGGILIAVAVYLTKGFWLSLSWWVYLLAAGIGLIIFAAVNERRKSGK